MSGYIDPPLSRPKWFTPLLVAWVLTGLPVAIVVPYFWITGTSPTRPPPAPTTVSAFVIGILLQLLSALYVLGSPIALALAERKYRKMRDFEGTPSIAHD
jgi:hypothetical protein